MTAAEPTIDFVVRARLKSLRQSLGWSLEELAERTHLGVSTLSRIETGKRAIDVGVLVPLCAALSTDISTLLDMAQDEDVIIRPTAAQSGDRTEWRLTRHDGRDIVAAKWRLEVSTQDHEPRVHPGHDWFFVLSGAVELVLGERTLYVYEGQAADFSTLTPHRIRAHKRPAEIITIFDRTGHEAHRERATG